LALILGFGQQKLRTAKGKICLTVCDEQTCSQFLRQKHVGLHDVQILRKDELREVFSLQKASGPLHLQM